jgi:hypothetical protein
MLGGAPGIGKNATARALLDLLAARSRDGGSCPVVQWLDVDALWLHQPWRVDDTTQGLVRANLRCALVNAARADIDVVLVTWVFQGSGMQDLVRSLAPPGSVTSTVQLVASATEWARRFAGDRARGTLDEFYLARYDQAQSAPSDFRIDTDGKAPAEVATLLADVVGLG